MDEGTHFIWSGPHRNIEAIIVMFYSDNEKKNPFPRRQNRCSKLVSTNYCIPGTMSRCSAGLIWQEQKRCKYAKKSTVSERCMHYIESIDGHCDSVEAQRNFSNLDPVENGNCWNEQEFRWCCGTHKKAPRKANLQFRGGYGYGHSTLSLYIR